MIASAPENIERIEWTLEDKDWQPSRQYLEKVLAAYKEAAAEIARLRAAYDSRGGEMASMRMVLAETQQWNKDRLADNERLRAQKAKLTAALQQIAAFPYVGAQANPRLANIARAALAGKEG